MKTTEITSNPSQLIFANQLEISPLNVRRTGGKLSLDELKASILAHGLMQNLVVTDAGDGTFRVIAGGRRLAAIHALQSDNKMPEEFAVQCQIVTEDHAMEMSLVENTVRLAMHPADQFEAFAALVEQGQSAAQVASRFGIDESLVLKRMKLARVAPQLLAEYRSDGMTLECLMAYTVTDDHRRQLKVFNGLQDWQKEDPSAIRDALTEKMIEASSKLARFVGLDAYTAAGGPVRADLFSEDVYLEKPALLNKLAEKKLAALRSDLEAEGWGWIEIHPERDYALINRCSRIKPSLIDATSELLDLKTQLDDELAAIDNALSDTESDDLLDRQEMVHRQIEALEERLAAFVDFDPEHKNLAGCFVSIGQDGTPFFDKGLVRPEHRKQLAKLVGGDDGQPVKSKQKGLMPETLRRDLAASRSLMAEVEIARHPAVALDLLVFQVASSMLNVPAAADGADVHFRRAACNPARETETTPSGDDLAVIAETLPADWLKPKSVAARFEAFRSLLDTAKLDLLAYCVALTLKPKLAPSAGDDITAFDAALSLTDANVAGYWRPAKDNYLGRITRDQLLAIGRDIFGETWAQSRSGDKKATLVDQLHRAFADPAKHGRAPDHVEKLKTWLPVGMAFDVALPKSTRKAA